MAFCCDQMNIGEMSCQWQLLSPSSEFTAAFGICGDHPHYKKLTTFIQFVVEISFPSALASNTRGVFHQAMKAQEWERPLSILCCAHRHAVLTSTWTQDRRHILISLTSFKRKVSMGVHVGTNSLKQLHLHFQPPITINPKMIKHTTKLKHMFPQCFMKVLWQIHNLLTSYNRSVEIEVKTQNMTFDTFKPNVKKKPYG